jgi:hypothetical protein
MPHLRVEPKAEPAAPVPTPAPLLIPLNPAPALAEAAPTPQRVLTLTPGAAPQKASASDFAPAEHDSGVRHTLLRNEPGIVREACGGVVYNSCS